MTYLASGLGGGLDVVNALLIYFAARNESIRATLGSIRPASLSRLEGHTPLTDNSALIYPTTRINKEGRYAEPTIAQLINTPLLYITRRHNDQPDPTRFRKALEQTHQQHTNLFFVDGGGDSLILRPSDANQGSEHSNPFEGGDAEALQALYGLSNCYHAVIAAGLDINEKAFEHNLTLLHNRGAYYGRINLATREKQDYQLEKIISFAPGFLEQYFKIVEQLLMLNEQDQGKWTSHTGVVTYHALKGNYGVQRTFVPWEPETNGQKGVLVTPEHAWMYFFNPTIVEEVKREINR